MKETLVAKNALAAIFDSSAVVTSVTSSVAPASSCGAHASRNSSSAYASLAVRPSTIRDGWWTSSREVDSRRKSGAQTTDTSARDGATDRTMAASCAVVPTGTEDLTTKPALRDNRRASSLTA